MQSAWHGLEGGRAILCIYRAVSWQSASENRGDSSKQIMTHAISTTAHIHAVKQKWTYWSINSPLHGKTTVTNVFCRIKESNPLLHHPNTTTTRTPHPFCQGCLGWTWALRTLCHCHAGMNKVETGPSISALPLSDYEQIMQLHSMLYITSYSHSLLLYTPFVPKLKNLMAHPKPPLYNPSSLPSG